MSTISVRLDFSAGHRILGLTGAGAKCRNPHGHTFIVTFVFDQSSDWPPPVEFGSAKAGLKEVIKQKYDHAFFVDHDDTAMREFLETEQCKHVVFNGPPTTERISWLLAMEARRLFKDATLRRVTLEEGLYNTATYEEM